MRDSIARAVAAAAPRPLWLDLAATTGRAPESSPALAGDTTCDLAVVGGGFSGLWTALLAKERDPGRDVVLIEAKAVGWAASGRNGGFVSSSLTHGLANGADRWPSEIATLERLGLANLDELEQTIARYGIDCSFQRKGKMWAATRPHETRALEHMCELAARHGREITPLSGDQARARVGSPTYLSGALDTEGYALVDPAALAYGLRAVCERLGVRVFERTQVTGLTATPKGIVLATPYGRVGADRVALATNVFPSLLRRLRLFTVPVYDYVLATEPLSAGQLASIGWDGGEGVSDCGNQFHYYRRTPDDRILWGGYDAVYHYGSGLRPELDQRPETFLKLAEHFYRTFPQLEGVRFSHCWGGAIDTCTRFTAFYGTAKANRVAYALGFTGLGVASTRFGANVMLDLLSGTPTERTELEMVRSRPIPFPPEPLRYTGVELTRRSMAAADDIGRRNLWLRTLDRFGVGFDS
ncbi:FAD-dependent oxidoreductase [Microtetraspora sp. NBRC 16547]|uniref:NAD(P)/FAD-dependent oxidoreductase n=1 Tax=Microtetraspora sp. NBRC 16547 TaxID=3030993 RepID=UPI0024A47D48|nr:FAD-dependent oxidoreductase [Microtetraspora sp. NBRC 16547]GLW98244.1 oxidoreductase [Microtetraspora sp. NBRC 16547]